MPIFVRRYPKLRIQLHVTGHFIDLVQEGFDIAIRSHFAALPDSDLVQRRMSKEPITLVAAPSYVEQRGEPPAPEALPEMISAQAVEEGRLIRILPGWTAGSVMATILTPHKRGQLPAVRAVIDFLMQQKATSVFAP